MNRHVITVQPDTSVADAIQLMIGQRISGLPVTDASGRLVGILSEADLVQRVELGTAPQRPAWLEFLRGPGQVADDYVHTHGRRVDDVMTRHVITVTQATPLDEVAQIMRSKRIKRLPVVADERVVGIISRSDLLRALVPLLDQLPPEQRGDVALRNSVSAAISELPWRTRGEISILVTDGVVQLKGFVFDLRERDALRVAAENVPGVRSVIDDLQYLDPNIGMVMTA